MSTDRWDYTSLKGSRSAVLSTAFVTVLFGVGLLALILL